MASTYLTSSLIQSVEDGTITLKSMLAIGPESTHNLLKSFDTLRAQKWALKILLYNMDEIKLYILLRQHCTYEVLIKKPSLVKLYKFISETENSETTLKCMVRALNMKEAEIRQDSRNRKAADMFVLQLSNRDR